MSSPQLKKGLHLSGMISIVCKIVWEHWEERYYLKDTFEYLLQSEEYLVYVRMLNAYNNIIISSLSHGLNEASAHMNRLWLKLNLGKMLVMLLEKRDTCQNHIILVRLKVLLQILRGLSNP